MNTKRLRFTIASTKEFLAGLATLSGDAIIEGRDSTPFDLLAFRLHDGLYNAKMGKRQDKSVQLALTASELDIAHQAGCLVGNALDGKAHKEFQYALGRIQVAKTELVPPATVHCINTISDFAPRRVTDLRIPTFTTVMVGETSHSLPTPVHNEVVEHIRNHRRVDAVRTIMQANSEISLRTSRDIMQSLEASLA